MYVSRKDNIKLIKKTSFNIIALDLFSFFFSLPVCACVAALVSVINIAKTATLGDCESEWRATETTVAAALWRMVIALPYCRGFHYENAVSLHYLFGTMAKPEFNVTKSFKHEV